jgi:hypothetical protein
LDLDADVENLVLDADVLNEAEGNNVAGKAGVTNRAQGIANEVNCHKILVLPQLSRDCLMWQREFFLIGQEEMIKVSPQPTPQVFCRLLARR